MQKINIFWFRRDLRLDDNHGLYKALQNGLPVLLIFIFDPDILRAFPEKNDRRLTFIYNALKKLQEKLETKQKNLSVFYGKPLEIFEQLINRYQISKVFCNHDYEPEATERDISVAAFLKDRGTGFESYKDQVIYEKNDILNQTEKPFTVFTPYMKKWKERFLLEGATSFPSEEYLHHILSAENSWTELEQMGYNIVSFQFPPAQLNEQLIRNYHLTRDFPAIEGTSRLGIHLRFGTLSVRKAVEKAKKYNEIWLNELIWREFFMQILWHFPFVTKSSFKTKYNFLPWRNDEKEFEIWCRGETGFPIVDAGIRQLTETGFMHNRTRMIVANFLTKLLLIDWRWGELFFADHLSDYELSSNNGNWQWSAGTGADAAPYFRIFSPDEQTKRFDPALEYVKKYAPYNLSSAPKPMIDYRDCRKRCLEVYKHHI